MGIGYPRRKVISGQYDSEHEEALDIVRRRARDTETIYSLYVTDNERRLTGAYETAPIGEFSFGVANRGCSVRIPRMTEKEKCGYFEDRRPASNMDPYIVTGKIMETCVLPDCA